VKRYKRTPWVGDGNQFLSLSYFFSVPGSRARIENQWMRRESVCQSHCRVAQEKYLEERGFGGVGGQDKNLCQFGRNGVDQAREVANNK